MHPTAMRNCELFFEVYGPAFASGRPLRIIEIGSQDVNGSLRRSAPASAEYIGVDFAAGPGVDVVLDDPYRLPFGDASVDVVLSSSCFEHAEMFWLTFLEVMRVLKPDGLFYLNAPSNGSFHRYPVDCWRFYPDSGRALVAWARRNGLRTAMLESYVSEQVDDVWSDFVAVFLKDDAHLSAYPARILDRKADVTNALTHGTDIFRNFEELTEDQRNLVKRGGYWRT